MTERWDAPQTVWEPAWPAPSPPARRGRVVSASLGVLALVLVAYFGVRWVAPGLLHQGPPPGLEEQAVPLGGPPLGAPTAGPYSFLQTQADGVTPVTYSPCRPIHYVVRPDGAPARGDALIDQALARISEATGLQFVADGPTSETPTQDREPYQPDRYGDRWAPVLVAWSNETETPELAGDVAGSAGSTSVAVDGTSYYVTGTLVLDAPPITELLGSPNGTAVALGVVTHEAAHVVGLGHVDDVGQLMNPTTALSQTYLANGDLAGLARVGTGPCAPRL